MATALEYVRSIVTALFLATAIAHFLVEAFVLPDAGRLIFDCAWLDRALVLKASYLFAGPTRGDLVVFEGEVPGHRLVSRVVGLPGERLEIHDGTVRVDGRTLREDYILMQASFDLKLVVPEESYFVMADLRAGRTRGAGSQTWGTIGLREIQGRLWIRYWPPWRLGIFRKPSY